MKNIFLKQNMTSILRIPTSINIKVFYIEAPAFLLPLNAKIKLQRIIKEEFVLYNAFQGTPK
jgi:hypothetical protein